MSNPRSTNAVRAKARVEDHLIAGTVAGLTSTVALFPLDLLKTHYQVKMHLLWWCLMVTMVVNDDDDD